MSRSRHPSSSYRRKPVSKSAVGPGFRRDDDLGASGTAQRRYTLAELLEGMTPEAMREAFDWGPDPGQEIGE